MGIELNSTEISFDTPRTSIYYEQADVSTAFSVVMCKVRGDAHV